MPVFFIDTSDEDHFVRDVVGHDLPDMEAAKTLAVDALPDMAARGCRMAIDAPSWPSCATITAGGS